MAQPFLRWAGSKRKLVPILREFWSSDFSRYIEPFAGSACLFFDIGPEKAILNDINRDLINTYKEIKVNPELVLSEMKKLRSGQKNYYRVRGVNTNQLPNYKKAARFIYLNRYCFNGLFRTNRKGNFNVPYGGAKNRVPPDTIFTSCSKELQVATLFAKDFRKILSLAKLGDFVYMDPPFSVKNQRVFVEYNPMIFGLSDIYGLRDCLNKLHNKGVSFLVSYASSQEAKILRAGFKWDIVKVRRNIASFSKNRRQANELLIYNKFL